MRNIWRINDSCFIRLKHLKQGIPALVRCFSHDKLNGLRFGHIPNAINIPSESFLDGNCYKISDESKNIFVLRGVTPESIYSHQE